MIVQNLKFVDREIQDIAEDYFFLIGRLNKLGLANREIQLLAFATTMGNIGPKVYREQYVKYYGSSLPTVGNMITKLVKKGLLQKNAKDDIIVIDPLRLDFTKGIKLDIEITPYINLADTEHDSE